MTKKQRTLEIIERLKQEYPDAGCTLEYDEAWKLLVSVRLAAQCTDARVNVVVQDLYREFPDVDALADADALRRHFQKLVRLQKLKALFQAEFGNRHKAQRIVAARGAHISQLLALADVDGDIVPFWG